MIRPPLQKPELSGTTTEVDNKLQVKENNLFNHVDKLAADHYVRVSNTMIKVTYKKALKDQNASDYSVDVGGEGVFNKSTSYPHLSKKNENHVKSAGLYSRPDVSFIRESPKTKPCLETSKTFVHHSTPKQLATVKESKYVNGLHVLVQPEKVSENSLAKVQKMFSPQGEGGSSPKRPKASPVKGAQKADVSNRFLKNGDKLVKPKGSIIQRNSTEAKKLTVSKSDSKVKKLENGVKKKLDLDKKGLKRKAPSTESSDLAKKMKINGSKAKEEDGQSGEQFKSSSGKKPIMLVDPDLPTGWTRYIRTKNKGSANEQYVVYVVSPHGKKFRFKWQLRKFLEQTKSSLDVDRFFFGLYHRTKSSNDSTMEASPSKGKLQSPSKTLKNSKCEGSPKSSDQKKLLLFDPDLPFGWRRVIHSNATNGRKQVHIISPDGKIFRRRYRLSEYLAKHEYTHNLDRFYFGLYPKKEGNGSDNSEMESENRSTSSVRNDPEPKVVSSSKSKDLPQGWKKLIRIPSSGGRPRQLEVVIISPDGRKHRSKKDLENYLLQINSKYKAEDFDFCPFGKSGSKKHSDSSSPGPKSDSEANQTDGSTDISILNTKRKLEVLDMDPVNESEISSESRVIDAVNGLMMSCGLSSPRKIRRQRLSKTEHEKLLKGLFTSESDVSSEGCEIPTHWIERLIKSRTDLRTLEPDAASAIGNAATEFIKKISFFALAISKDPGRGLVYEDLAELVHRSKGLSPLQTLIPKKITYKEYIKLNRPQQFWS